MPNSDKTERKADKSALSPATIRLATADDSSAIRAIYACYIDSSITFETELPSEEAFRSRVEGVLGRFPCLVLERDGVVVGYAYAHELTERAAYRWNAELSVYLSRKACRKGSGTTLYQALLDLLKAQGYRKAFARVTLPNAASKRLHAKLGFKLEWTQKRAGWKAGRWHNVAWFSKQLLPQNERGGDVPAEPVPLPRVDEHANKPIDGVLSLSEASPADSPSLESRVAEILSTANERLATLARKPVVSASTRKCMQGNTATDTKPEQIVRKMLRDMGLPGYRLQWKQCPGKPDIAYPGRKVAIFVNGCFWHRCPTCNLPAPKSNVEFWEAKFARNVERDRRNQEAAQEQGWTVATIWEHDLKPEKREETGRYLYELISFDTRDLNEDSPDFPIDNG